MEAKLQFPYEADSKRGMFSNYLFGGKHIEFPLIIQTCRYIRTPVIKVYADIEWILNLKMASVNPEVYSYANFGASSRTKVHNKKAIDAAVNAKRKTKGVSFELDLDAKYIDDERHGMVSASYENKIKKMLELLVYIKNKMDSITGVDGSRAKKSTIGKLKKKLLKVPITFQLDFPVISIEGSWKNGQMPNAIVKKQGSIIFGFTPLIKGKGSIDILTLLELIPVVGQILKAANMATLVAGIELYINLYAWGEINLTGEIHFNKEDDFALDSDTTLGIGVEFGVKAEANTKKLTFKAEKTSEEKKVGFELGFKGETSITVGGKAGNAAKGPFIEVDVNFNGITVFVTARFEIYRFGVGPKDEPYLLMKKPEEPLCKKRWYLLENN